MAKHIDMHEKFIAYEWGQRAHTAYEQCNCLGGSGWGCVCGTHFVISTKLHFAVTSGINKFYVSKCLSVRSFGQSAFYPHTPVPCSLCVTFVCSC